MAKTEVIIGIWNSFEQRDGEVHKYVQVRFSNSQAGDIEEGSTNTYKLRSNTWKTFKDMDMEEYQFFSIHDVDGGGIRISGETNINRKAVDSNHTGRPGGDPGPELYYKIGSS